MTDNAYKKVKTSQNQHQNNVNGAKAQQKTKVAAQSRNMIQIDAAMEKNINEMLKQTSAKIIPSGSPQIKRNAQVISSMSSESPKINNHKVWTPQPSWALNPGESVITSTPNRKIDEKVRFSEGNILSPILNSSSQDKHFHTPIKNNESGIFSDTNNSATVKITSNAGSNLSRTLSSKQKKLAQKYNIDINPASKPSSIENKIWFFDNQSNASHPEKPLVNPGRTGIKNLVNQFEKNASTSSNSPIDKEKGLDGRSKQSVPNAMRFDYSSIVHTDIQDHPTPSAPLFFSTMDSNKSSIGQNDIKKISDQNNTKTIISSEGKRLMNDPQISNDVREGHRVKRLIDLFEQCSKLSDVNVASNQLKLKR